MPSGEGSTPSGETLRRGRLEGEPSSEGSRLSMERFEEVLEDSEGLLEPSIESSLSVRSMGPSGCEPTEEALPSRPGVARRARGVGVTKSPEDSRVSERSLSGMAGVPVVIPGIHTEGWL